MRDSATAAKVLVLVSIDEFQWVDDTDTAIALQQIHRVEPGFALDVDQVFEVPTHEVFDLRDGADGDVARVVGVFGREDVAAHVGGGEAFGFGADAEDGFGGEGVGEEFADALGRGGQLVGGHGGSEEVPLARLHLPPEFAGGFLPFVVEVAPMVEVSR